MAEKKSSRGFQGAVLKLLRAGDYQLTVTGRRRISPHYLRLSFQAGGMLNDRPPHPTQWIRMWFADSSALSAIAPRVRRSSISAATHPQRSHEGFDERPDHLGLLGHLTADRPLCGGEPG
jgi:NADPH-dependent ferric siderophore reductase